MENVKGMYPYDQEIRLWKDFLRYDLWCFSFGSIWCCTKRPRLFFIGIREDNWKINISDVFAEIKEETKKLKKHILKDALAFIKPLVSPRIKNMTDSDDERTEKNW